MWVSGTFRLQISFSRHTVLISQRGSSFCYQIRINFVGWSMWKRTSNRWQGTWTSLIAFIHKLHTLLIIVSKQEHQLTMTQCPYEMYKTEAMTIFVFCHSDKLWHHFTVYIFDETVTQKKNKNELTHKLRKYYHLKLLVLVALTSKCQEYTSNWCIKTW